MLIAADPILSHPTLAFESRTHLGHPSAQVTAKPALYQDDSAGAPSILLSGVRTRAMYAAAARPQSPRYVLTPPSHLPVACKRRTPMLWSSLKEDLNRGQHMKSRRSRLFVIAGAFKLRAASW